MSRLLLLFAMIVSLCPVATANAAEHVETIDTQPGVTQGLYVVTPDTTPWASAILYVGGQGNLALDAHGPTDQAGNFLMRIRDRLLNAGILLVYPDTPSDKSGGYNNFRSDSRHGEDGRAIVAWTHILSTAPIFVIGTSRGTISAAYIAAHLETDAISGVALTSSVTRTSRTLNAITSDMLGGIRVPTLVMANKGDLCGVTPPDDVPFLLNGLKNAPHKASVLLSGGLPPIAGPCEGKAAHGFYGIEDEAAKTLIDWMTSIVAGG